MDFLEGPQKDDFKISFPKVPEYEPGALLAMEKEVLGIYISGHPLEADRSLIEKNITASAVILFRMRRLEWQGCEIRPLLRWQE